MAHPKFRAAFDLLAMRAEIEGGEYVELVAWWHEYQLSNIEQRINLIKEQQRLHPKPKRKYYLRNVVVRQKLYDENRLYCLRQQFKSA